MAIPRGSHYEPGSNRHLVRLSNGSLVSRNTAENMFAQSRGYQTNYERKQAFSGVKAKDDYERGKEMAQDAGTKVGDYIDARVAVDKDKNQSGGDYRRMDRSPDGPLAKYLVAIGRRDENATYAVGDSPK